MNKREGFDGDDCLRRTGVYAIVNIVNGNFYIGSTSRSFAKRFRNHRHDLDRGTHHCAPLQRAWLKYGHEQFLFCVIEEVEAEGVIVREQAYLDKWAPPYNVAPVAGSPRGVKHTEESRMNMSAAQRKLLLMPGYLEKRSASVRDACATEESRRRRSEAQKQVVGRGETSKLMWSSEEFRARNVLAMKLAQTRPEVKAAKSAAVRARNIRNSPVTAALAAEVLKGISAGRMGCELARQYGIGKSTVSRIKHGAHWAVES